ncbi:MAG: hypothetical protein HXY30_04780 [Pseudorhodoplanes sp.]|nr:hypothetical protein [Pseudorhodoplanes sp.]
MRSRLGIGLGILAAIGFAAGTVMLMPRAIDAVALLLVEDDPAALADRRLDRVFDARRAAQEIDAALAAKDVELARSFVDLARERHVPLPPGLAARVDDAEKRAASASSQAQSFARGLVYGEPDGLASLAGTALGDLFVFGDIRDALREGVRLARGEEADTLILGLAGAGIAITAGTYATLGAAAPARIGLTVVKAAAKTGRLGARMSEWIAASLRRAVDGSPLRRTLAGASITEPALAVRATREAVKAGKADDLLKVARDVGRVQARAGTHAALDGLKIAEGPRDMARVARLAEKNGGTTRAILKTLGRGAIALSMAAIDLAWLIVSAALAVFGFVSSLKATVERATWRHLQRRQRRLARRGDLRGLAMTGAAV